MPMIDGSNMKTFSHCCCRQNIPFVGHLTMGFVQLLIVMNLLFTSWSHNQAGHGFLSWVEAVSVQRLNVPDLVVIDQLNQQQHQHRHHQQQQHQLGRSAADQNRTQSINLNSHNQPEAASLINSQDLSANEQQSQITFECLISFDRRKDKNLIVKWHHDDRVEPIYQWIPELNKRSIAPQYRAYIAPIVSAQQQPTTTTPVIVDSQTTPGVSIGMSRENFNKTNILNANPPSNQIQLLEAGFRLVRPSKELGGKYTCSAISTQNDDSKWKKMIVYTPPRSFRFNASRTDIGAQLASQRERLIQMTQPAMVGPPMSTFSSTNQLPLAYRMKGFDKQPGPTTISPQMYSTIDYVNVNQQQRARQSSPSSPWLVGSPTPSPHSALVDGATRQQNYQHNQSQPSKQIKQNGVKLVCDIDQVFPVPEVSIYRLAKLDGSHPDKLAKLDTRIETNPLTGLYHVQVISILEDDELEMKYGSNEPVYFECLIALTNLELSKYADNKRSIVYRPGIIANSLQAGTQTSEDINIEQAGNSANSISTNQQNYLILRFILALVVMSWSVCYSTMISYRFEIVV